MKKEYLKKKIIKNLYISLALSVIAGAILFLDIRQKQKDKNHLEQVKSETQDILNAVKKLEREIEKIKTHKKTFLTLPEKRKNTNGIKIEDFESKISSLGSKYNISNISKNVSFPKELTKGVFDLTTINMVSSLVNISFTSIDDVDSLLFISELTKSLPGYVIIDNINLEKKRNYVSEDLINISSGKEKGVISSNFKFYWYVYASEKEESAAEKEIDRIEIKNSNFRNQ